MTPLARPELRLPDADVLLVVPPLAHVSWPSLGVHLLQAVGREAGLDVGILYLNAVYAERVGPVVYSGLCNAPVHWMLGERLFTRSAFGTVALGTDAVEWRAAVAARDATVESEAEHYLDHLSDAAGIAMAGGGHRYAHRLDAHERLAHDVTEQAAAAICARAPRFVGVTTTFDQTAAAVALCRAVKARAPHVHTALGGANCDGPMADGVTSLSDAVDTVFSGESEASFVDVVRRVLAGDPDLPRIVRGTPCRDLDALPVPDFADWYAQALPVLGDHPAWHLLETSRGCWWGAKRHCTFCGLNGESLGFRAKTPDRALAELRQVLSGAPTHRVAMTDNIMPHAYHRTLIPKLAEQAPAARLFYEQKANLRLAQVRGLVQAGVTTIQPGIEALDTPLLDRLRKGVLARQNVALLRYSRSCGMHLEWALLWGFPGDDADSYRRTLALLPALTHLQPPQAFAHLHLDRFSPYVEDPTAYGIGPLEPLPAYRAVFPESADISRLAYHFQAPYQAGSHDVPDVIGALRDQVEGWRAAWNSAESRPVLEVRPIQAGGYQLLDTRGLGAPTIQILDEPRARAVLVGGPRRGLPTGTTAWAERNRYTVDLDGWSTPLATAPTEVLERFEALQTPALEAGPRVIVGGGSASR